MNRELELYFSLAEERPELFRPSPELPICMDRDILLHYRDGAGRTPGVLVDNSPYFYLLSDLIRPAVGGQFTFMRVVPCSDCGGSVILPRWRDGDTGEVYFGLLRIFRHGARREMLELPRGHMDPAAPSPEENARKELREELGVRPGDIASVRLLGTSYPDSGLTAGKVYHFLVDLTGPRPEGSRGHEGIRRAEWLTRAQLLEGIRSGEITDGMTQTALLHFLLQE